MIDASAAVIGAGNGVYKDIQRFINQQISPLGEILKDRLTERSGWWFDSIANDIRDAFDVDAERAENLARTETARTLNQAREEGYKENGSGGGLFKWTGPADHRETECCRGLREETEDDPDGGVERTGRRCL